MRRVAAVVVVIVLAISIALLWPADEPEPGPRSAVRCLPAAGVPSATPASPAVIAMLGDERDSPVDFDAPHVNRVLRISVPAGEIERERTLGRRRVAPDTRTFFRVNLPGASLLAVTRDHRTVIALVRDHAPGRDSVAVLDAATLATRCMHPLEKGVRYTGLLLGRSGSFYAYGSRPAEPPSRSDAVLTVGDVRTGALAGTQTLREAATGRWRGTDTDWYVFRATLSPDERRLVVSYHGHDTTGADQFRVWPGSRVLPTARARFGRTDIDTVHGAVAATGAGFVGTAGERGLVRLDRDGRLIERMQVRPTSHLMDFAFRGGNSPLYTSGCRPRPTIQRIDLARRRQRAMATGPLCGLPLTVDRGHYLVLSGPGETRRGRIREWPQRLLIVDLENPSSGKLIPRPGTPLDALVVGRPG